MTFTIKTYHSMFGSYHQGPLGTCCAICNTGLFIESALFVWINGIPKYNGYPPKQWVCSEECATMFIFQTME